MAGPGARPAFTQTTAAPTPSTIKAMSIFHIGRDCTGRPADSHLLAPRDSKNVTQSPRARNARRKCVACAGGEGRRMIGSMRRSVAVALALVGTATAAAQTASGTEPASSARLETTASVLWQPSMNVFRRFAAAPEKMFEFYGAVLGFKQLTTLNVNAGGRGVARFQAGAQELKLTGRVGDKHYVSGGVTDAMGLRLLTFTF